MEMLALHLVNATGLCKGLRTAAGKVKKSILDFVIVSEELYTKLEEMIIDDESMNMF